MREDQISLMQFDVTKHRRREDDSELNDIGEGAELTCNLRKI